MGNLGSAFINEAAATRYIFARMNPILKQLFIKDDFINLEHQNFEGVKIEPRYYVPVLPMLAINGSEGVSIGFAQKILPRDPKQILKWVKQTTAGKRRTANLKPFWNGMKCTVEQGETSVQWLIKGSFTRKTKHRLVIDALPVGYTLKQYNAVLDKLTDDKVIKSYEDLSDDDNFEFEVYIDRAFGERTDQWILEKLKLIKKVSENFTCIDENNKIIIFNSINELMEAWYVKRIDFNVKRKAYLLAKLQEDMDYTNARAKFIQGVVDGVIELRGTAETAIVKQATKYDAILVGRVEKFLSLPMRSLTKEEIAKLKAKAKELKAQITSYNKLSTEDILEQDLSTITI